MPFRPAALASHLVARLTGRSAPHALVDDLPIRGELFSVDRLEQHARSLAASQPVHAGKRAGKSLVGRLRDNEKALLAAYRTITAAASHGRLVSPAADWLLDNFHLVEQQVREVRIDLPSSYYRQLPKVSDGPLAGYPRVFGLAWAFVAHTDSHFDPDTLGRFVRAYQAVQPLDIGELWAIAITLRIVLVENLRRAADLVVSRRREREQADLLADRLLGANGLAAAPSALAPYEHAPLRDGFVVQLVQRLREQDPQEIPAVGWLERRLAEAGTGSEELVRREHHLQGATNVTVRNIITSMRLVSDVDWAAFFESVSPVDSTLRAQSSFTSLDFATRNLYRTAIEQIARGTGLSESGITQHALEACHAAQAGAGTPGDGRRADPGYYLIGNGRRAFEQSVGFRARGLTLRRRYARTGIAGYVVSVAGIAALVLLVPLFCLALLGIPGRHLAMMALAGALPALDTALQLMNRLITGGFGATMIPGLALRDGVPPDLRTMVVVPTLLADPATIEEQVARLEVHYLSNPNGAIHFALLSDWTDADTETVEGDAALLAAARAGIERLNRLYPDAGGADRFFLLHRRRIWNDAQRRWIGWERKRGKLHELNHLLRSASETTFLDADARPLPRQVRYIVTLDSDTRLPRDAVVRLVGKMAHPLNRPRLDPAEGRIVEGYGVLQPRVTSSLPVGTEGSLFQRIFSGNGGIDPYSSAMSDVYQDLFGVGSYSGKGIYDIDAFEAALRGRVPDSTMLSHDLFEGTFARAGLASDIEVVEEFPARYDVAAGRQHRWARGDWQLLPWMLGSVRRAAAESQASYVPALGFWKMFDNLRRTLTVPAVLLALFAGWMLPLPAALAWTGFVILSFSMPAILPVVSAILPRHAAITTRSHLGSLWADVGIAAAQSALLIAFLAHHAWLMIDAIGRTLFRLIFSHRRLLEWITSAQSRQGAPAHWLRVHGTMVASLAIALVGLGLVACLGRPALPVALPFVAAWFAAPAIAIWVSRRAPDAASLSIAPAEVALLRLVARRTWRYFETFVDDANNMLPPDNFQEDPAPVLARRTSPTNIGLLLLSTASACEFGWLGRLEAVERLEATLATLRRMKTFRGHFFNWYDTADLRPLDPPYVSTVDSGNLAGHLIAIAGTCAAWREAPAGEPALTGGAMDALAIARDALRDLPADRRSHLVTPVELGEAVEALVADLTRHGACSGEARARAATSVDLARTLASERGDAASAELLYWVEAVQRTIASHGRDQALAGEKVADLHRRLAAVEAAARGLAGAMEFGFLFDTTRRLLSIGYLVVEDRLDPSCYDLLASEARLASFMAIAAGEIPVRHWFRLGREATPVGHGAALVSWSGSMFEYLMPSLVMRAPMGSLLERTNRLAVRRQVQYAAAHGVPWGISESAYNARDKEFTYQYSSFGVPGLGFKRGLGESIVIAPYATSLAAMVDPAAAAANFTRLAAYGARSPFGFYEALDFTPSRLPDGVNHVVVRASMAHHQGMTIVAIANCLLSGIMRSRFHADPKIQATELLLQERAPRDVVAAPPRVEEAGPSASLDELQPATVRRLHNPHAASPSVHLLSNGRYSVMLTAAGSGFSQWGHHAVTRWREDTTRDDWGSYLFLRDVESGVTWSATHLPGGTRPDRYDVMFAEDRAEFTRQDGTLTTSLDVVVSPEEDAEVRRLSITNTGDEGRVIEVTSYMELVLAPRAADAAHQAFSKLFVQTEFLPASGAVVATRRRRGPHEPELWAAHLMVVEGDAVGGVEFETDRARFLGPGNEVDTAVSVRDGRRLSGTVGTVLDPVFALRRRLHIPARSSARIACWTMVAGSRPALLDAIDRHRDANAFARAATLAWTQAQVQLHHLDISAAEAARYQRLAGHVLYANNALRAPSDAIRRGMAGPPLLWAQGISGDRPIVLVRVEEVEETGLVREMLRAHEYWQMKGLPVDLVIVNERSASYIKDLQVTLETLTRTSRARISSGSDTEQGGVFVLRADLIPAETRSLLMAVARVMLTGRRGSLSDQLERTPPRHSKPPARRETETRNAAETPRPPAATTGAITDTLQFFNGIGGFSADGSEYVIVLGPGQTTPAPWINVIANPSMGFQVAADGAGYTWSENSRDNQLTPWSNDPVSDRPGEAFYVRDLDSGEFWSPTARPARNARATYVARHGQGYSRFEVTIDGIASELVQFVATADPVKVSRLILTNRAGSARRLEVTGYVEWVLGLARGTAAPTVVTGRDVETGALFARNRWNQHHGAGVAFADLGGGGNWTGFTGDRTEFIGRNGTLDRPAGLTAGPPLSKRLGAGLDPCAAIQSTIELAAGESRELVFLLGQGRDEAAARELVVRYRAADPARVQDEVAAFWNGVLGTVQVRTPDRSLDLLLNNWLLYQSLACRTWARAAFYQAGGAYGFRDQLQDAMSLAVAAPELARAHILRAAGRQFVEGDVQHWWFPVAGQGVRTRISDDKAWLATVAAHYVRTSGDAGILDADVPFLTGPLLKPGEHDLYYQPERAEETASLFEHCARGLDASLAVGAHGLPLFGTGDWNDGMNRVGEAGLGESVWLAWFLYGALTSFAPYADARGETARAASWRAHAEALRVAVEREAWDGDWYRRGFYDDGTPLGSAASEECRIDSIAQSWSVLSEAGDTARAAAAMASLDRMLVHRGDRLSMLFTPPFDRTLLDPGYIKGYPPGIRENGGQYTHAAAWAIMAHAALGEGDKAAELFALINPINHTATRTGVLRYKVEPYVVAADVYSIPPHVGRGGWTWYTGSAGWLYRAGIESLLGLRLEGEWLTIAPCIPAHWTGFALTLRYRGSVYEIAVVNPHAVNHGVLSVDVDGVRQPPVEGGARLRLAAGGATQEIFVTMGRLPGSSASGGATPG
jgi:cyclic beta-1,2-glucan synthetase